MALPTSFSNANLALKVMEVWLVVAAIKVLTEGWQRAGGKLRVVVEQSVVDSWAGGRLILVGEHSLMSY